MTYDDSDYALEEYYQDLYESELVDTAMREASEDNVRQYLCTHGDAVEKRARCLLDDAVKLSADGFHGAALTLATISSEVVIRYLLLRPLVQGAFLDDVWAGVLTKQVLGGRSADERSLLPRVLKAWGVEITSVRMSSGEMLWESFRGVVWETRNSFIHRGEPVEAAHAGLAIECSEELLGVAREVGRKFGCGPYVTGLWAEARLSDGPLPAHQSFTPASPFE